MKTKHRDNFTPMQYRVWAEMHVGGVHNSTDNPPNTTMFVRAGGTMQYPKKITTGQVVSPQSSINSTVSSPAKLIENSVTSSCQI